MKGTGKVKFVRSQARANARRALQKSEEYSRAKADPIGPPPVSRLLPLGCRDLDALEEFYDLRRGFLTVGSGPERTLEENQLHLWFYLIEGGGLANLTKDDWVTPLHSRPRDPRDDC